MSRTYFKAVRPDGTDFYSGRINYLTGGEVRHPDPGRRGDFADRYLSISTVETDCTGFRWPARLLRIRPVGRTWRPNPGDLPNKRAALAVVVIEELQADRLFGPQGEHVAALIERTRVLSAPEINRLGAAWDAAWDAARDAAWAAAWDAARDAAWAAAWDAARAGAWAGAWDAARAGAWAGAWDAAWDAAGAAAWAGAWDTAGALVVRDLIGRHGFTQEHYDLLTRPWRTTVGKLHPADPESAA